MIRWSSSLLPLYIFACCCLYIDAHDWLKWPYPTQDFDAVTRGTNDDPGSPAFLTPLIEKGKIDEAQKLSSVTLDGVNVTSFAGFFTVEPKYESNMFFWYFPSENNPATDPLILWLQGGPGASSMFALFCENGPFFLTEGLTLKLREYSWSKKFSMLFIDNPVGAGFSFTKNDAGYATTEEEVAENLFQALKQFFMMFPKLKEVEFYLTGESYAGKYVPALAYRILKEPVPKPFHMRGVAIGDGWSDPEIMLQAYPNLIFNTGLFDERQRDVYRADIQKAVKLIQEKQYLKAAEFWNPAQDYFATATGGVNMYNYLYDVDPPELQYYPNFLNQNSVRRSIHVGNLTYQGGATAGAKLQVDLFQTMKPVLAEIMNTYKVLLYNGQLDIIVGAALTEAMLYNMTWKYSDEYKLLPRSVWYLNQGDKTPAGYVRQVHDFYQVIVRGGGHLLPFDQPARAFDMIQRFVYGKPFSP